VSREKGVQLSLHHFFWKVDAMLSASTFFAALKSSAVGGLNCPSREGISNASSSVGYNSHC